MPGNFPEIRAIGSAVERMLELYRWLRDDLRLESSRYSELTRELADAVTFEFWVEADLSQHMTISYGLELILREGRCDAVASVLFQLPDGQREDLMEVATARDPAELAGALELVLSRLWKARESEMSRAKGLAPA